MTDNPHAPPTSQSAKPVAWRYHYPGAEKLAEARQPLGTKQGCASRRESGLGNDANSKGHFYPLFN